MLSQLQIKIALDLGVALPLKHECRSMQGAGPTIFRAAASAWPELLAQRVRKWLTGIYSYAPELEHPLWELFCKDHLEMLQKFYFKYYLTEFLEGGP